MVNQRIERWADAVKDALAFRLGGIVTKSYDANKDCFLTIPSGNLIIKFEVAEAPVSGAKDSLGLTQTVYAPHVVKVLWDNGVTAGGGAAATENEKFQVYAEVVRLGAKVQAYSVDAGADGLVIADLATATLVGTYENLEFGGIANV
jgi:hypothetical protein